MTRVGFTSSTFGSFAVLAQSASSEMPIPGVMTPPRYSPRPETQSNVVAVPKSTTMQALW